MMTNWVRIATKKEVRMELNNQKDTSLTCYHLQFICSQQLTEDIMVDALTYLYK